MLRRSIVLANERQYLARPGFVTQLLDQGIFLNDMPGHFNAGSTMHPGTIVPFFTQYGLSTLTLLTCEGLAVGIEHAIAEIAQNDTPLYQHLLALLFQTVQDPSIHGMSGHLLYVGRKNAVQGAGYVLRL